MCDSFQHRAARLARAEEDLNSAIKAAEAAGDEVRPIVFRRVGTKDSFVIRVLLSVTPNSETDII